MCMGTSPLTNLPGSKWKSRILPGCLNVKSNSPNLAENSIKKPKKHFLSNKSHFGH